MDLPGIRDDIHSALITTRNAGLLDRDHLCCGNSGLAETLLTAGIKLQDRELTQDALRIMSKLTARANLRGSASIASGHGFFNPSLFQGAAGVGYQLLRVARPDIIPSVLLFE
jgi:lantibiotic modifying enzyme